MSVRENITRKAMNAAAIEPAETPFSSFSATAARAVAVAAAQMAQVSDATQGADSLVSSPDAAIACATVAAAAAGERLDLAPSSDVIGHGDSSIEPSEAEPACAAAAAAAEQVARVAHASDATHTVDTAAHQSGLKPIKRLTSDTRLAKIIPQSHAAFEVQYCSLFVREFIRSDYNFCAAKVTIARGGKVKALDAGFRQTEEWLRQTIEWLDAKPSRTLPVSYETIQVTVTHPLAGRLIRLLSQFDRIFVKSMEAKAGLKISSGDCDNIMTNASKRVKNIARLCEPDNDRYHPDGKLRDA